MQHWASQIACWDHEFPYTTFWRPDGRTDGKKYYKNEISQIITISRENPVKVKIGEKYNQLQQKNEISQIVTISRENLVKVKIGKKYNKLHQKNEISKIITISRENPVKVKIGKTLSRKETQYAPLGIEPRDRTFVHRFSALRYNHFATEGVTVCGCFFQRNSYNIDGIEVDGLTVPRLTTMDHNSKHKNIMDIS